MKKFASGAEQVTPGLIPASKSRLLIIAYCTPNSIVPISKNAGKWKLTGKIWPPSMDLFPGPPVLVGNFTVADFKFSYLLVVSIQDRMSNYYVAK